MLPSVKLKEEYQREINFPICKVEMDLDNVASAQMGATITATSEYSTYIDDYIIDGQRTHKDGKYWQSNNQSDGNGDFASPEYVEINFGQTRKINRIKIYSYPKKTLTDTEKDGLKKFTIQYNTEASGGTWYAWEKLVDVGGGEGTCDITNGVIDNNTKHFNIFQDDEGIPCRRLRLKIEKTQSISDRARLCEIEIYRTIQLQDESEIAVTDLETGNVTKMGQNRVQMVEVDRRKDWEFHRFQGARLNLSLLNYDKKFSPDYSPTYDEVTNKGYFNDDIRTELPIRVWLGFDMRGYQEFVPAGEFYVKTWNIDPASQTISITAKDKVLWMKDKLVEIGSSILENKYVEYLLEWISLRCNISADEMILDDTVQEILYFFPKDKMSWETCQDLTESLGDAGLFFNEYDRLRYECYMGQIPHEWEQTTKADWEAGERTNIDITTEEGSFMLQKEGNRVLNPSFETGSGTDPFNFDNWTEEWEKTPWNPDLVHLHITRDSAKKIEGTYSCHLKVEMIGGMGSGGKWGRVRVISDLFAYIGGNISFWVWWGGGLGLPDADKSVNVKTRCEGKPSRFYEFYGNPFTEEQWQKFTIPANDISSYIGCDMEIEFEVSVEGASEWEEGILEAYFDAVIYTPYYLSGDLLSQQHDCSSQILTWGKLNVSQTLNGQTIIWKTTVSSNGTDWDAEVQVDSNFMIMSAIKRYIKVHSYLSSQNNRGQTPVVYSFVVNYYTGGGTIPPTEVSFNFHYDGTLLGIKQTLSSEAGGKCQVYKKAIVKAKPYYKQDYEKVWEGDVPFTINNGEEAIYYCELNDPCSPDATGNDQMKLWVNGAYRDTDGNGIDTSIGNLTIYITRHPTIAFVKFVASGGSVTITSFWIDAKPFKQTGIIQAVAEASLLNQERYRGKDFTYENDYLYVKAIAESIANTIIENCQEPKPRVTEDIPVRYCPQIQIMDRVNIKELNSGISQDYQIFGYKHKLQASKGSFKAETSIQAKEL